MTNKTIHKLCILATFLATSACQGAYQTTTGKAEPVLDMRATQEKALEMETISTGGIIMKRSYDPSWEMPKRDVDRLREEFTALQQELLQMSNGQERRIAEQFNKVENRVAQMRNEEMRQAAKDIELMALVKSKFDVIDKNISYLKASEMQKLSEKNALLGVLDEKFQAVDGRLAEIDKTGSMQNQRHKEEIKLALQELASLKADKNVLIRALDKKFTEVEGKTESLESSLKGVAFEQEVQKRLVLARKQAMEEAREIRLLEELAIRKEVEEARRLQLSAVVKTAETEKKQLEMRDYERAKEQAAIELKMSKLREQLTVMEANEAQRLAEADERERKMKESLEERLTAVQETYDVKLAALQSERELIEKDLNTTKDGIKEKQEIWEAKVEKLKEDKLKAEQGIEEYRTAIEERVFAMEERVLSMEDEKLLEANNEDIHKGDLAIGRIVESSAKVSGIEMTPGAEGGVVGGYAQEDWIDLEDYQVVLHENNSQLSDILDNMLKRAEPYVGPWQVRWKLKESNMDVIKERFSLDVETDFDSFASYISNYMKGYRGFGLTFNIFRAERILVITD
tara:strand:+ start:171148 stop:172860 length:1713 start_codon:yes stop_codon:yes gene_type:complete